jgi:hypothetical protein
MSIFNRPGVQRISESAISELGAIAHPRLSIKGGRFTLIDAGGTKYPWPQVAVPVVFVGANPHKSKLYFGRSFDDDDPSPPICYSDNGIAASINAQKKMARTCAECELGAWNSGDINEKTGRQGKACTDKKKLALVVIGDDAQHVYEMQVPPASLKHWAKYVNYVTSFTVPDGSRKADICDLVTLMSFDPDEPFVLAFKEAAWIDQVGPDGRLLPGTSPDGGAAFAARLDAIWQSTVVEELVGLNDVPWTPPAPQLGAPPTAYLEQQPQGGALQRGSTPATGAFAGPPGAAAAQPQRAFVPQPTPQQLPVKVENRGGAGRGQGRKPKPPQEVANPPFANGPTQTSMFNTLTPAQQERPTPQPPAAHAPPASNDPGAIPPFLQRTPQPPAPQQAHGMADAPLPTGTVQAAIDAAFSLNTKRA